MKTLTLFIFTTFIFCFANAQKAFVEDLDDEPNARLAMNRANPNQMKLDEIDKVPTKSKKVPLLERFSGPTIADSKWTPRAEVTLWYDNQERLVSVVVDNAEIAEHLNLEQTFTKMCEEEALY